MLNASQCWDDEKDWCKKGRKEGKKEYYANGVLSNNFDRMAQATHYYYTHDIITKISGVITLVWHKHEKQAKKCNLHRRPVGPSPLWNTNSVEGLAANARLDIKMPVLRYLPIFGGWGLP